MKILHISHLYSPSFGGTQILNQELSETLVSMGEDVTVFTSNAKKLCHLVYADSGFKYLPKNEVINGVKVRRFRHRAGLYSFVFNKMTQVRGGCWLQKFLLGDSLEIWQHGPCVPSMLWDIYRLKPDVIMVMNIYPATLFVAYLASKWWRIPLVVVPIIHQSDPWKDAPIVNRILTAANALVALTRSERDFLVDAGYDKNKISVIGVGVHPEQVSSDDGKRLRQRYGLGNDPVVGFVGRKCESKGVVTLLQAMRKIWGEFPKARLLLAGNSVTDEETVLLNELAALSKEKGSRLAEIVDFKDEDKAQVFAACDIFAMPSNIDSFGISYLEAWANGKPVIACHDTAQETLIDEGKDGLLTQFGDVDDLADAIKTLLKDEEKRISMGQNGKDKVLENYTWDRIRRGFLDIYRRVTVHGSGRGMKKT